MRAYVTSIEEPTTNLCVWSLKRQGFDVILVEDPRSTLAEKLKYIYNHADDDFIRVDADVIVNRNIKKLGDYDPEAWWVQGQCFGWYAQDLVFGGVQLIRREALPALRANIDKYMNAERPETAMSRLPEFYNPRRFQSEEIVCGIHGWKQDDLKRVMRVKAQRGQSHNYDWDLVIEMNKL